MQPAEPTTSLALHCLHQAGFETYAPRLRERRTMHGRPVIKTPLLFVNYVFISIELQWRAAQKAAGVARIVMNGTAPAAVPDFVIRALRVRERDGLIDLPAPPGFHRGDRVRVLRGPFADCVGSFVRMRPRERVAVLLRLLGGAQRVELPADALELVQP